MNGKDDEKEEINDDEDDELEEGGDGLPLAAGGEACHTRAHEGGEQEC